MNRDFVFAVFLKRRFDLYNVNFLPAKRRKKFKTSTVNNFKKIFLNRDKGGR